MGRMHRIPRVSFEHILVLATSVAYEHCAKTLPVKNCVVCSIAQSSIYLKTNSDILSGFVFTC